VRFISVADASKGWIGIIALSTCELSLEYELEEPGQALDSSQTKVTEDGRVQAAAGYTENAWTASGDTGWTNHRQATFTMMKGFEANGTVTITVGASDIDWFEEVSGHQIGTRNADGSCPYDYWGGQILSTAWALPTLDR
jgi:hypothetical protein